MLLAGRTHDRTPRDAGVEQGSSFMKILVIGLSNLGDALLTYPALHALWAAHPGAEFHILVSPRTESLFAGESRFQRVWVWKKNAGLFEQLGLIWKLARQRFGLVVDFRNSVIPLFMVGAKRTPLFGRARNGIHRAEAHLKLVTSLGIPPSTDPMRLPFGDEEKREVAGWLQPGKKTVIVVPGARSHLKRWDAAKFAQVADILAEKHHAQIILIGEEAEQPISKQVRWAMKQPSIDRVGKTTLRQLAALLPNAALVITNDNGCLHAAEASGVPVVAIFGPTDERKYGPRNPKSIVVRKRLHCVPCEKALCRYDTHECMQEITAAEVYAAAARVLDGGMGTS